MFQPKTLRVVSMIAIVCSAIGLVLSVILMQLTGFAGIMGIVSWAILLWASVIGYQLSKMKLYEEEYKKIGLRIYAILVCFFLFLFIGIIAGLAISVIILSALWALKSNYDDWEPAIESSVEEEVGTNL